MEIEIKTVFKLCLFGFFTWGLVVGFIIGKLI